MAFHSEFHMPGAFHEGGVHPGIFRAPHDGPPSASSSGYLPSRPTNDDYATPKRKRFNHDVSGGRPEGKSYTIAGRIDTPNGMISKEDDTMGDSMLSDGDYRKMLGTKRPRGGDVLESTEGATFNIPLSQQSQQQQTSSQGWGSFAVSVVGKIWQFCRPGSFRGFHAGAGQGYDLQPSVDDVSMLQDDIDHDPRQIPGRYPGAEWSEKENDVYINSRASTPTGPAVKRRQTTAPKDDLGKNWVMVNDAGVTNSRAGTPEASRRASHVLSPRNRNSTPSVTTGRRISTPASRRMAQRQSMAATPTATRDQERPQSSASFASQRSPSPSPTKISTPQPQPVFSTPKTTNSARRHRASNSIAATPTHRRTHSNATPSHRRTTSNASMASGNRGSQKHDSFESSPRLNDEARRLAAKRKKADEYADYRVTGLNHTVMDLIRQGQEALATKVDVEGNGWEDDD